MQELFEACLHIDPTQQTAEALRVCYPAVATCKGVVLFCDDQDRPVQLLVAANIRRIAKDRLFPDECEHISKRADISQVVRRIYYLCCYNDFRSMLRHLEIARAVYPDSWRELITLGKLWYVRINQKDQWPNFSATSKVPAGSGVKCFGPFSTRKSADKYISALRGAFHLCQRPDLVDSAQKATTCPYLQMNTCPAPCVGRMGRQAYLEQISKAVAAAGGDIERYLDEFRRQMTEHARQMRFEQANAVKGRLEALEALQRYDYRWTTDLSKLAILHIDRSAKIPPAEGKRKVQTYAAFLIRNDRIVEFADFVLADIDKFHESFLESVEEPAVIASEGSITERMSLAGYFLYRSNHQGIWINCSSDGTGCQEADREHLLSAICEKWGEEVKTQKEKDAGD